MSAFFSRFFVNNWSFMSNDSIYKMQTVKYTTGREVEGDDGLNGPKRRQTRRLGPRGVLRKTVTRKMGEFFCLF